MHINVRHFQFLITLVPTSLVMFFFFLLLFHSNPNYYLFSMSESDMFLLQFGTNAVFSLHKKRILPEMLLLSKTQALVYMSLLLL